MRHDPVIMLRSLKMHGMARAASDLMEGSPAFDAAIPILSQLLKAETAEREVRSVAYQIKVARFPVYKDLAGRDKPVLIIEGESPEVDQFLTPYDYQIRKIPGSKSNFQVSAGRVTFRKFRFHSGERRSIAAVKSPSLRVF
jgi:hypothetical protein